MKDATKDILVAFGAIMSMLTVWSFVEAERSKTKNENQVKLLHAKLNTLLKKVG